jgi:hypothetical protein
MRLGAARRELSVAQQDGAIPVHHGIGHEELPTRHDHAVIIRT